MNLGLGYVLAVCLLLAGCGAAQDGTVPAGTESQAEPAAMDWRTGYKSCLADLCDQDAQRRMAGYPEGGDPPLGHYVLYDIDKDGVPEMLVEYSSCEADRRTDVYGWADGAPAELGQFSSGHCSVYTWPGENAAALRYGHMGVEYIYKIRVADGALTMETLLEAGLEEPVAEYTDMASFLPGSTCLDEQGVRAVLDGTLDEETGIYTQGPNTALIDRYVETLEPDFTYNESGLADWQRGYADFLRVLCKREAAVRNIDRPDYDPNEYPGEIGMLSEGYCLYDIDKDGTPELFIRYGNSEAAYHTYVYGWADGVVAELGDFYSGHSSLYTWPEENAVAVNWGHMGGHYVEKISLVNGALAHERVFEERVGEAGYTDITDIVSGSLNIREVRTTLGLTFLEEAGSNADRPLLLPVYNYGRERGRQEPDTDRDAVVRAAITAVLADGAAFYGVSADGFGGDTGWTALEQYLAPGGVDRFADAPQTLDKLAWVDMDGDGQTECLLALRDAEGWPDQYVILSEQEGTVYAYCVNYCGSGEVGADGVFRNAGGADAFAVSFWKDQCYPYSVPYHETVPELEWEQL